MILRGERKVLTTVEAKLCEVLCLRNGWFVQTISSVNADEFTQCLRISVLKALERVRIKVSVK